MRFAEPFPQRFAPKRKHGRAVVERSMFRILAITAFFLGFAAAFQILEMFYPENPAAQAAYGLVVVVLPFILRIRKISLPRLSNLLLYFGGTYFLCRVLEFFFPTAGNLPNERWVMLSIIFAAFLWTTHEIGREKYAFKSA